MVLRCCAAEITMTLSALKVSICHVNIIGMLTSHLGFILETSKRTVITSGVTSVGIYELQHP
jgi:hypothetical protein